MLGVLMLLSGAIMATVCGIWILVLAFGKSVLWGLGCLFIPIVSIIFVIIFWGDAKKPAFYYVVGIGMYLGGMLLNGNI